MTVIAIWHRPLNNDLYVIADSRLTSHQGLLTNNAPKLFTINVKCYGPDSEKSFEKEILNAEIGIGYAGSSSVAFSTIATLQLYTASLVQKQGNPTLHLNDIAELTGRILRDNFRQFGVLWGEHASCEFLIFGALQSDHDLNAIHIKTENEINDIKIIIFNIPIINDKIVFGIGSGISYFLRELEIDIAKTNCFDPFSCFIDVLSRGERDDIGGSVQVAIAEKGRVTLPHVITPRPDRGDFNADVTFLGRHAYEIGPVGECDLGRFAVAPHRGHPK